MIRVRSGALSVLLCLAAVFAGVAVPAGAPTSHASDAAKAGCKKQQKCPGATVQAAKLAGSLAKSVTGATSPQARYNALVRVMKMLSLGEYTADGKVVEHGAERSTDDFYLYDVELRSLAGVLGTHPTYSLSDLADSLTRAGIQPGGQPVDPETLRQVLVGMVQEAAAEPHGSASVAPDLVRDLGLARTPSYDLANSPSLDQIQLDALQYFLFEAELLVPRVRQLAGHGSAAARTTIHRLGIARAGCGSVTPETKKEAEADRKTGKGMLGGLKKLLDWERKKGPVTQGWSRLSDALNGVKLAQQILNMLHGLVLSGGIVAERLDNDMETHYGPAGHAPGAGDPLKFQIRVSMAFDLGADQINCLALAGYNIPKKGPIPGVPVRWDIKADNDISKYGTLDPAPSSFSIAGLAFNFGSVTTTDANGVATLTFTPNTEKGPPIGISTIDHGSVDGMVEWGTAFGSVFGKVNQFLTPISDVVGWNVGFHKPRGYTFDITERFNTVAVTHLPTQDITANVPATIEIVGHSCGDDPYSDPWTVQVTNTVGSNAPETAPPVPVTLDRAGVFHVLGSPENALNEFAAYHAPGGIGLNSDLTLELTYTSPFEARLHVVESPTTGTTGNVDWTTSPAEQTFTAPLEEDMSCPAT
jgi:hypothetical protein